MYSVKWKNYHFLIDTGLITYVVIEKKAHLISDVFFMKKLHCIQISNRNTHYKPNAMTIYKSIEFTDQNKNMCLSNLCYIVTSTTKWFIILKHGIFGKPLFLYCSHAQWSIYLCVLCLRLINFGKDAQILIVPHASIWTQKITIMAYIFSSLNRAYDRMWRYGST